MRIGLFTDSYLPRIDGIAVSVESFRTGLEELGHTVFIFCPKRPEFFIEPNKRIYRFASIPSLSYDQYRDTFPFTPKHVRNVTNFNLDIIHTFTQAQIGLFGAYIAKRNRIPLVTTCSADFDLVYDYKRLVVFPLALALATSIATRSFMSPSNLFRFFKPSYPFQRWLDRSTRVTCAFYNDQCDLTTVPSLKTGQAIAPFMKYKPVVLPCGTDLRLVPKETTKNETRTQLELSQSLKLFVSASRLVREKRIDFVIRAFSHLSAADREISALIIIGDGPETNALKKLTIKLGLGDKTIFIGRVEHKRVLQIIAACDIYVHASLRETQGLVLNEAAACGKPLIMIDREVNNILHEGENGLFAKNTLQDYSKIMTKFLHNEELCQRYGRKSKEYAKKTDLTEAARPLVALYGSLLHN